MSSVSSSSSGKSLHGPKYNSTINYLFTSSFDINSGVKIEYVSSKDHINDEISSISAQLGSLLDSILPSNLHKFMHVEHATIIPLLINERNLSLYPKVDINDNENISLTPCYLFTISYLKHSTTSIRNANIKSISIVTTLPLFNIFKPLLLFLLHESFIPDFNHKLLDTVLHNLNDSHLHDLVNHFSHLNSASRFILSRIQPDFSLNNSLKLNSNLSRYFVDSNNLFKTSINLGSKNMNFPIQIPKNSIINSQLLMFGIDLQRESNIKNLINLLESFQIFYPNSVEFKESCLTPYANIKPLHILLNALILNKKIVLYAYNTCYNILNDFAQTLYLLFTSSCSIKNAKIPFYPIVDLSTLHLVEGDESYLVGTSNPLLMEKLDWDLFLNLDSNTLHVQTKDSEIDYKYFDIPQNQSQEQAFFFGDGSSHFKPSEQRNSAMSRNPRYSIQPSISSSTSSNISSIDSFHADDRLPYWDPECFPKLLVNKNHYNLISNNLKPEECINFAEIDNHFVPSKFPSSSTPSLPRIDNALDCQLDKLINNHHDDETLFILITNYLRNLTTRILPAFYHFTAFLQIRDYRAYLLINSHLIKKFTSSNGNLSADSSHSPTYDLNKDVDMMIRKFIKSNNIIQPFPLNYPFDKDRAFLDDPKIAAHYTRIVLANVSLLRLSVHYNSIVFTSLNKVPNFVFSWNGGSDEQFGDEIEFINDGVDVRLDTHYLISILDRMIDNTSTDSWQLDKYLLLQIFKVLNSIFKFRGSGVNGLSDVLIDLFIEKRSDESFHKSCGTKLTSRPHTNSAMGNPAIQSHIPTRASSGSSFLSNFSFGQSHRHDLQTTPLIAKHENSFLEKLKRLSVSPTNIDFIRDVIKGGDGLDILEPHSSYNKFGTLKKSSASIHSNESKVLNSKKNKVDISTQVLEDDELITHIGTLGTQRFTKLILVSALYLSIRGPEDLVETKNGLRRKDLLLTEFKKFLSGVLNDPFFKDFILVEMDDFVKLTVNDFIDYHM